MIVEKKKTQNVETHTEMEPQELGVDFCMWTKISSDLSDSIAKPHIVRIRNHRPVFGVKLLLLSFEDN